MDVVTREDRRAPAPDPVRSSDGEGPAGVAGRVWAATRHALPALLFYTGVRLVGVLTVYVWARTTGKSPGVLLSNWDGGWYLGIAQHGYDGYEQLQSNMAFFPLYPGLTAALEPLSPLGHRDTAFLIAWIASLAAAWGLFVIGDHLHDRRVGILLVAVWGVLPHSIVQSMSYSEGLFTALAAWCLYALLRGRWLTAAVLCFFAGLTRPTASSLIAVVGLAALTAIVRRRDGWRPWVALLLAPAGWLGYLAWAGAQTGHLTGWFHIQEAGWGSTFDFGVYTWERGQQVLSRPSALDLYLVTVVLLLSIMMFVLSVLDRQPWQLLLYSGLLLVTTVGAAGYYHSKARFLLPAFPLLLPAAAALVRAGWARAITVVAAMMILSAYFGGYLMIIWNHSP